MALTAGVPVIIRSALEDFATNPLPSARAASPDANLWIIADVLCCRGSTCTVISSTAACTAPVGVGAVKKLTESLHDERLPRFAHHPCDGA